MIQIARKTNEKATRTHKLYIRAFSSRTDRCLKAINNKVITVPRPIVVVITNKNISYRFNALLHNAYSSEYAKKVVTL